MSNQRRAEKIIENYLPALNGEHELIESVLQNYPKEANVLRPRLEAASWLVKAKNTLEPQHGFISSSRKALEEKLASDPVPSPLQRLISRYTPQRWAFNLVAPVLLLAVIALVINNLILSAKLSIPGDPLYTSKLFIEEIQLAFTFNRTDKTELSMQFSRERTTEFVQLVLEGDYEQLPAAAARLENGIVATLHLLEDVSKQDQPAELLMVSNFHNTLSNEIDLLNVLEEASPPSYHSAIAMAILVTQAGIMVLP